MGKYFNFKKDDTFMVNVLLFVFIAVVDTVLIYFSAPLEAIGYRSWAFFCANIIFMCFPEPDFKARIIKIGCGAVAGLVCAWATIMLYIGPLASWGEWGIIVPVLAVVGFVFLVEPFVPVFFNMATFLYFTIALVKPEEAVLNLFPACLCAILGVLVLDVGFHLIIKSYSKYRKKNS